MCLLLLLVTLLLLTTVLPVLKGVGQSRCILSSAARRDTHYPALGQILVMQAFLACDAASTVKSNAVGR